MRTSNVEHRTSNVEPKRTKRERCAILSVSFTLFCSKFEVRCSMFLLRRGYEGWIDVRIHFFLFRSKFLLRRGYEGWIDVRLSAFQHFSICRWLCQLGLRHFFPSSLALTPRSAFTFQHSHPGNSRAARPQGQSATGARRGKVRQGPAGAKCDSHRLPLQVRGGASSSR